MKSAMHPHEEARLGELRRYDILDTPRERDFDEIVEAAAAVCGAPVAVINLIDEDRQWFKAEVGLGVDGTPRNVSICSHAILEGGFVEIRDTLQDDRTRDNPLCYEENGFRYYAGCVLESAGGYPIGTLCILDREPRTIDEPHKQLLQVLSNRVMRELELRGALKREKALRLEIDHRVKNSLASIASIISLKERRVKSPEARNALQKVRIRIKSLSALHAELHDHGGRYVNLSVLFDRAITDMQQIMPDDVELTARVDSKLVPPATANAMLVIANEFAANSVKHGFKETGGQITLEITTNDDGTWQMICQDTGSGDPTAAERASNTSGLGTQVIRSVARSVCGTVEWQSADPGMRLTVTGRFED